MQLLERLTRTGAGESSQKVGGWLAFAISLTGVLFFVGAWELITGKPFRLLESAWSRLEEWQQALCSFLLLLAGILGILLVLQLAFGVQVF